MSSLMNISKISTLNCHSMATVDRMARVEKLLMDEGLQVCLLQETFLKRKHTFEMENYELVRTDRGGNCGGTAIAIKKGIDYRILPVKNFISLRHLEVTVVTVNVGSGNTLYLISWYNSSQSRRIGDDVRRLMELLVLDDRRSHYIFGGDLNANHASWGALRTSERGTELFNLVEELRPRYGSMLFASKEPSRCSSGSYLDLFIVGDSVNVGGDNGTSRNILRTVASTISDHSMVVMSFSLLSGDLMVPVHKKIESRMQKIRWGVHSLKAPQFQVETMKLCDSVGLSESELSQLSARTMTNEEIDAWVGTMTDVLTGAMESAMKRKKSRRREYIPRKVAEIVDHKRKLVRRLYYLYRNRGRYTVSEERTMRHLKLEIKHAEKLIREAWREHQQFQKMRQMESIKAANRNEFFQVLNRTLPYKGKSSAKEESFVFTSVDDELLTGTTPIVVADRRVVVSGKDVDTVLCNGLEVTFRSVDGALTPSTREKWVSFTSAASSESIVDDRFMTMEDLSCILKSINTKKSCGPDGIPNRILKWLPNQALRLLLIIFNNCINNGYIPKLWKISSVTFLKKDATKHHLVGNYRPISLMSNVSKLLERFYVWRLESQIVERDLISARQFGFRPRKSTTDAIGDLVKRVQSYLVRHEVAAAVFVDLKKAFDSVSHKLLMGRMREIGISEEIVGFFAEFLGGRTFIHSSAAMQLNCLEDVFSTPSHKIERGVLQGSISGPILFILFIDRVLRQLDSTIAYADDLVLVLGGHDVPELQHQTQLNFRKLERELMSLGLEINKEKTKGMLFRDVVNSYAVNKQRAIHAFRFKSRDGTIIKMVESYCYLGVTLDKFLKFNLHVQEVVEKASLIYRKCVRILRLDVLDVPKKAWFYNTVIRPIITYACPIWVFMTNAMVEKMEKMERRVLRTILGQYRRPNGRFYSYRSQLERANLTGIGYQIIKLTRRYCVKLWNNDEVTFNKDHPNWTLALMYIKGRCFIPESFMFLDSMLIIQDFAYRNRFFGLDRHGLARKFSLNDALNISIRTRKLRMPTTREVLEIKEDEPWRTNWEWPEGIWRRDPHVVGE